MINVDEYIWMGCLLRSHSHIETFSNISYRQQIHLAYTNQQLRQVDCNQLKLTVILNSFWKLWLHCLPNGSNSTRKWWCFGIILSGCPSFLQSGEHLRKKCFKMNFCKENKIYFYFYVIYCSALNHEKSVIRIIIVTRAFFRPTKLRPGALVTSYGVLN